MRDEAFKPIKPPPTGRYRHIAVACAVALGAELLLPLIRNKEPAPTTEPPASPAPPAGWSQLGSCSQMISLDETKRLKLLEDQRAVFRVKQIDPKGRSVEGRWEYDEDAKRYTVTLNGTTSRYSVISLPGWSERCLFVTGDITAVDLRASWISYAGRMDDEFD